MARSRCILALGAALLLGMSARTAPPALARQAQPGTPAPIRNAEPLERALARVPRSAELVVVVDGLAAARRTRAATGIAEILVGGELRANWGALSTLLGWSEDETLDRLLGDRVLLVSAELERADDKAPWVLLSEISAETAARIKARIPSAPRKAVEGLPIFALERGEYEMATVQVKGDDAERVMFLVGPTGRATLFDTMAGALSRGIGESLASTPVAREMGAPPSPGVLVALRVDQPPGAPAGPAWSDFLVCAASPTEGAWDCRLTMRDAGVSGRVKRIAPTSDAPFRAMARGAMLAVLETRLADPGAEAAGVGGAPSPANFFERALSVVALPAGSGDLLTGRQALAVWPRDERKETPDAAELCVAFAVETSDVSKMAPVGDRHLSGLVARIEETFGAGASPPPDFQGVSCQAVRNIPLQVPTGGPVAQAFGGSPRVAWSYPATGSQAQGASPGWWQVCVTGTNPACAGDPDNVDAGAECSAASKRMVGSLLGNGPGETERWVSVGAARPTLWVPFVRMLVGTSDASNEKQDVVLRMFERISAMSWRLRAADNGDVVGTLRVEMK
jgi:hypothetical protein